jgi:hypothetical protein
VPAPYQLHTTRPYLTSRTYRENAEALGGKQTAKRDICDLVDLDRGYDIAEAAILQGWKEQRRRYFHG